MIRGGLVIIVGLVMPITAHAAGQQYKTSEQVWKLSDKCTAEALKKYPDYTQESLEKREQHIKQCNQANRTPSRQPLTAPPPAPRQ